VLVAREGESVAELLGPLDTALGKALAENIVIDGVMPGSSGGIWISTAPLQLLRPAQGGFGGVP
jgi:hypothetical protein